MCLPKSNHASCSRPQGLASGNPPLTDCSHARDFVAVSFPSPVLELRATRRIAARSALFGVRLTSFSLDPFARFFPIIYKANGQEIGQPESRFSDRLVPTGELPYLSQSRVFLISRAR